MEGTVMAHGRARDERKERRWRRWIDQWRASGLSVRDFCARRGLATPSFYAWRRRLQHLAADTPAVVPVQVVADAPPAPASALELVLADGWVIKPPAAPPWPQPAARGRRCPAEAGGGPARCLP